MPNLKGNIAVIGGGLSGKMLALTLAHSGFDITMIAPLPKVKKRADRRTTTIHHAGAKMLEALGVSTYLKGDMTAITKIAVAIGAEKTRQSDWLLQWQSPKGGDDSLIPMAYVVENYDLSVALDKALDDLPDTQKITVIDDHVISYHEDGDGGHIETSSGAHLTADLIVACDGAKSPMRDFIGLSPRIETTNQTAIIADLTCELPHDGAAYQRFLPTGPIALMPMTGKMVSLVWSTSHEMADKLLAADAQTCSDAITEAFGHELGRLVPQGALSSFPLHPQFNAKLYKGRVILAGDAAHAIHPLAGMGYNLALADAAILLDILQHAKSQGLMPSHASIMTSYQARRKAEIFAISHFTSELNKLISRPKGPLSQMMAFGMAVLDKSPLKSTFRKIAMGGTLSSAPLFKGKLS